jgi:cytochrome P450
MVSDISRERPDSSTALPRIRRRQSADRLSTTTAPATARRVPLYRQFAGLVRDPLHELEAISRDSDGAVVQLDLGLFRPYLVTHPDHVHHVLRERASNYLREGMLWSPVRRLIGNGISGEGPRWAPRRRLLQPMFSAKHIGSLLPPLAQAITAAVADLDEYAQSGEAFDLPAAMTRIVHRALISAFFGDRVTAADADRLGPAIATAFTSLGARMVLPFVPNQVPLPGDRAFRRAVRTVDEVMAPLVRQRRLDNVDGDLVTLLCQAREEDGQLLDDQAVRDDIVSIFVAATETTAMSLTWLWVALDANPDVAAKVRDEVQSVVGSDPLTPAHLPDLRYLKMVLQEQLRMYPVAWFFPRAVQAPDVIGGVPVEAGATVILSPYLTQRMERVWERPHVFDPERFAPGRAADRHRFAYFPFAAGPHQCLGNHLFLAEAALVVAAMTSRFSPRLRCPSPVTPRAAVTLRPAQQVEMTLAAAVRP